MTDVTGIYNTLLQSGVLGAVLIWFMLRLETIMKDNTKALIDVQITLTKLCSAIEDKQKVRI